MRTYQRMSDDIPLISTMSVPEFSPYTAGRNLAQFQQPRENIVELFSQVPEPDKIETISPGANDPVPYDEKNQKIVSYDDLSSKSSSTSNSKRPLMNLFFVICLIIFIVICANFFTKTIENMTNNSPYLQYLMIAFAFFFLAGLFAWGLNF
jgi:hypothetical protein